MKCKYCNGTGEHINDANRMTTCEFCGGTGEVEVVGDSVTDVCDKCGGTGKITLTNEEYIRTCSTEELAKTLYDIRFDFQIPWKNKEIIGWLKEKHNE